MRQGRRPSRHAARPRVVRRLRAYEGDHHMPLSLRLAGLLISIAIGLTACDRLTGLFSSGPWNLVGLVLLVVVVSILVFQRMRKR